MCLLFLDFSRLSQAIMSHYKQELGEYLGHFRRANDASTVASTCFNTNESRLGNKSIASLKNLKKSNSNKKVIICVHQYDKVGPLLLIPTQRADDSKLNNFSCVLSLKPTVKFILVIDSRTINIAKFLMVDGTRGQNNDINCLHQKISFVKEAFLFLSLFLKIIYQCITSYQNKSILMTTLMVPNLLISLFPICPGTIQNIVPSITCPLENPHAHKALLFHVFVT